MITETQDRANFIGGSEANMIYMNYTTKTFKEWWVTKIGEIAEESSPNLAMAVGTILEHEVVDLYERVHNVTGERDKQFIKGFARANTDYIITPKVSDIKVSKKAREWHEKGKVPIQYKRQLVHYRYVCGLSEASIIAYQSDESLQENPFQELTSDNLFEIPVEITDEEIQKHHEKIEYLSFCRDMGVYPI